MLGIHHKLIMYQTYKFWNINIDLSSDEQVSFERL